MSIVKESQVPSMKTHPSDLFRERKKIMQQNLPTPGVRKYPSLTLCNWAAGITIFPTPAGGGTQKHSHKVSRVLHSGELSPPGYHWSDPPAPSVEYVWYLPWGCPLL